MESPDGTRRARPPRIFAGLLMIFALPLLLGGVKLISLGGSPYYAFAGAATAAAAVLLWLGRRLGTWIYGAMLTTTLVWALWESGRDAWALAPRLIGPFVLGLWLLTPWVQRGLDGEGLARRLPSGRRAATATALMLVLVGLVTGPNLRAQAPVPDSLQAEGSEGAADDWPHYGGDIGGSRYSQLGQITPDNVSRLEVAWRFETDAPPVGPRATLEVTVLKIGDVIYACNGANVVYAIDPDTGRQIWRYDPRAVPEGIVAGTCRGVAYFETPDAGAECPRRIFTTTIDARLVALDAATGLPCRSFGQNGEVALKTGLGPHKAGLYQLTSAPVVLSGKIVVGGRISDNVGLDEPSGVVRGYDAVTGAFTWAWDLGRPGQTGEPAAGERYTPGTPNVWAPMSADPELGLVFMPTGNATPDYWGGARTAEMDRYSSAVVAIEAATGAVRWSFQTTHHDLWDYDVPAQPTLVDFPTRAGSVPAVIQATKRGEIFVLDRGTGAPLTSVEERPAPQGDAKGERYAATQPYSTGLPSFGGERLRERDLWGLTPIDQLWCRIRFKSSRYDGPMTPPGVQPTIAAPGYLGGIGWGGVSVDTGRQLMVVNWNRVANYVHLLTREEVEALNLSPTERRKRHIAMQDGAPYAVETAPFLSPLGVPCQEPPFGSLSVVDLNTRQTVWTTPLGTARDSGPMGIESPFEIPMGAPNEGGSIVTRSGLVFISASRERALFAYDVETGRQLWKTRLPAGGQATPMTFRSGRTGRQYVVIAAGGHPVMDTKVGNQLIAYALPEGGGPNAGR